MSVSVVKSKVPEPAAAKPLNIPASAPAKALEPAKKPESATSYSALAQPGSRSRITPENTMQIAAVLSDNQNQKPPQQLSASVATDGQKRLPLLLSSVLPSMPSLSAPSMPSLSASATSIASTPNSDVKVSIPQQIPLLRVASVQAPPLIPSQSQFTPVLQTPAISQPAIVPVLDSANFQTLPLKLNFEPSSAFQTNSNSGQLRSLPQEAVVVPVVKELPKSSSQGQQAVSAVSSEWLEETWSSSLSGFFRN